MTRIIPLSRQAYGKSAFKVMDKKPDAKYWKAYETKLRGQYFTRGVIEFITEEVEARLPKRGKVLDLMCGRQSYVEKLPGREVHGISLVRESLELNPVLTSFQVKDLNADPWVDDSGPYDAAIIAFGLNYLTRPLELLSSVYGFLKNWGNLIVVCSDNCYVPAKAPSIWESFRGGQKGLASEYLERAGFRITDSDGLDELRYWDISSFLLVGKKIEY